MREEEGRGPRERGEGRGVVTLILELWRLLAGCQAQLGCTASAESSPHGPGLVLPSIRLEAPGPAVTARQLQCAACRVTPRKRALWLSVRRFGPAGKHVAPGHATAEGSPRPVPV